MLRKFIAAATMIVVSQLLCSTAAAEQEKETAATAPDSAAASAAPLDVIELPPEKVSTPKTDSKRRGNIAEVIVTAQRREESAQDVPISITVLDQQQLSNANISSAADLAPYTPSLATNTRFGNDNASFAIRGFTQDLRTTASVGTYFAEVIAPRGQSVQTSGDGAGPGVFFDLENVQVLKGPQGTLFGRNTTGGAVLIVPKKPTDRYEGYVEGSYGNFDAFRQQAVVNVPLAESFKVRLGIDHSVRDGYIDNYTGIGARHFNDVNYVAYRGSALWDVTEHIENYTILQYVDSDTNGNTAGMFACNPNAVSAPVALITGFTVECAAQLRAQAAAGKDGFYDVASSVPDPVTAIKELRAINTTTWRMGDDITLKNILAYAHLRTENTSAVFGNYFPTTLSSRESIPGSSYTSPDFPVTSQQTWVEEIQMLGSSLDSRLQWQAGLYYENSLPDGPSGNTGASLIRCEQSTITSDSPNCIDLTGGTVNLGGVQTYSFETKYLNRAAYAQGTYDIVDELSVTLGLRYTWDETSGKGTRTMRRFLPTGTPLPQKITDVSAETKSDAPTGLIEFSYKPNKLVMGYAKYVRGYRQGNINMTAAPGLNSWEPEHVNTYEIGAKTMFGGPVPGRFNIAAFYNDLTNMQLQTGYISSADGANSTIFNAGKARIEGVEVEAFFELVQDLTAGLSYSYLDTKLVEQQNRAAAVRAAGGLIAIPIADQGDSLPFAADHTVVLTLNYLLPLDPGIGNLNIGATYAYTGERRTAASSQTPNDMLPAFSLLNLNLNWRQMFGSPFDLSLFCTNVLDKEYSTYYSGTWTGLGYDARQVGQPRMYGVRARYNFGT